MGSPLKFTALGQTCVALNWIGSYGAPDVSLVFKTSRDADWMDYTLGQQVNLNDDDTVEFKAKTSNPAFSIDSSYFRFDIGNSAAGLTANVKVEGDITTLLEPEGEIGDLSPYGSWVFQSLFETSTESLAGVEDASGLVLPSTALPGNCYAWMFYQCITLKDASFALPAEDLSQAPGCYSGMFSGCGSLEVGPDILATTWDPSSQQQQFFLNMFSNCICLERFNIAFDADAIVQDQAGGSPALTSWMDYAGTSAQEPTVGVGDPGDYETKLADIRSSSTIPTNYAFTQWSPPIEGFHLSIAGKDVSELYIDGRLVRELWIDGKPVS